MTTPVQRGKTGPGPSLPPLPQNRQANKKCREPFPGEGRGPGCLHAPLCIYTERGGLLGAWPWVRHRGLRTTQKWSCLKVLGLAAGTASDPGGKRSGALPQRRCTLKALPGEPSGVRGQERPCHPSRVSAGEGVSRVAAGSRGGGRPRRGRCVRRAGHTWGACCPQSLGWGGEPRGSGRSLLGPGGLVPWL